jgi:hypothetical protein
MARMCVYFNWVVYVFEFVMLLSICGYIRNEQSETKIYAELTDCAHSEEMYRQGQSVQG